VLEFVPFRRLFASVQWMAGEKSEVNLLVFLALASIPTCFTFLSAVDLAPTRQSMLHVLIDGKRIKIQISTFLMY
jgi:hypothetical protein